MMMNDSRQYAPATLRNRDFILGILRDVLPTKGVILEIASGSGEHVVHFARNFPSLVFQPSDREPDALQSVAAWMKATSVTNVRAPVVLDGFVVPDLRRHAQRPVWALYGDLTAQRCDASNAATPRKLRHAPSGSVEL
jgi:hypothetical protein